MANANWLRSLLLLIAGGTMGGLFVSAVDNSSTFAQRENPQATPSAPANPQVVLAHLQSITPPNSHPMVDVAMFAAYFWFAGKKKNWQLANYYLG